MTGLPLRQPSKYCEKFNDGSWLIIQTEACMFSQEGNGFNLIYLVTDLIYNFLGRNLASKMTFRMTLKILPMKNENDKKRYVKAKARE